MFRQWAGYESCSAPEIDDFTELRAAIYILPLLFPFLECRRLDFAIPDWVLKRMIDLLL